MKTTRFLFFAVLIVSIAACSNSKEKDNAEIRNTFKNYKNAILNKSGEKSIEFVTSSTISYYDDILKKVKYLDSAQVDQLSIMDKMMVLTIRHKMNKEDILSFSGKELFIRAVEEGMIGKNSVKNLEIDNIEINGREAFVDGFSNEKLLPDKIKFLKENEKWKFDLSYLLDVTEKYFKVMQIESDLSENKFLAQLIFSTSLEDSKNNIWLKVDE